MLYVSDIVCLENIGVGNRCIVVAYYQTNQRKTTANSIYTLSCFPIFFYLFKFLFTIDIYGHWLEHYLPLNSLVYYHCDRNLIFAFRISVTVAIVVGVMRRSKSLMKGKSILLTIGKSTCFFQYVFAST